MTVKCQIAFVQVRFPFASCCPKQGNLGDISLICSQVHGPTIRFIWFICVIFISMVWQPVSLQRSLVWPEDAAGFSEIPHSGRTLKNIKNPFPISFVIFSLWSQYFFLTDLKLFEKESRTTQLVFSYQGGKKVSSEFKMISLVNSFCWIMLQFLARELCSNYLWSRQMQKNSIRHGSPLLFRVCQVLELALEG